MYEEEYEENEFEQYEEYDCMPAKILRYVAEILTIIIVIGGLITCSESAILGIGIIVLGLLEGCFIWVVSLVVRVCYKYLGL